MTSPRQFAAVTLCLLLQLPMLEAQRVSIAPVKPTPVIIRSYLAADVPGIRATNTPRITDLIRGGALYLTAQDAIALGLENNIDIEIARYNPILASWRLERSKAGGLLPGVPSNTAQVGSVATGQGVIGSQAAAGVSNGGPGGVNQSTNVTISQIGPVTQNLDPSVQSAMTFSHTSTPQQNTSQSQVNNLIADTRVYSASIQQGFLTGGAVTLSFRGNYLSENAPTDFLNPSNAANLSLTFQHNLLNGFGIAVNSRNITVARMNLKTSDLVFRTQVIGVVTQVLNAYYRLSAAIDDLRAKQVAADVARTLLENVTEQVKIGSMAETEITRSRGQVATARLDAVNAQTTLEQQELQLKTLLSRNGLIEPALATARVVPLDRIGIPDKDDLPPIEELVKQARASRSDLATTSANLEASNVSALGTKNGLLPQLMVFGGESHAGLAGTRQQANADPYFVGGMGTAVAQTFRRNFPTERIGAFIQAPLKNRTAQADYAIDQLGIRQAELNARKEQSQVEVDLLNSVISMRQARARYRAAVQNRLLAEESLAGEQKRYALGASTPAAVIQLQRDQATAQSAVTSALVTYSNARIELDRLLGRTLEVNNVSMVDASQGTVQRQSTLPDPLPNP